MLIRAVKKGYLFAEVPYRLDIRNAGISKAVSFPSLWQVIKGYIRLLRDIYYGKKGKVEGNFVEGSLTAQGVEDGIIMEKRHLPIKGGGFCND